MSVWPPVESDGTSLVADVTSRMDVAQLAAGESSIPWLFASSATATLASGTVYLTYFKAQKTETINNVKAWTSIAAGATPTIARYGIYSEAANGDVTLINSTANDTTLWAAATTGYLKALTAPWTKVAGVRYAFGIIVVTAAALPSFVGPAMTNAAALATIFAGPPRRLGQQAGQTDLPSSIAAGSIANSVARAIYAEFT